MTVVCYDGEMMAADRKSRLLDADGVKQTKSLKKEKICTDFDGTIFDGEQVYAVGRAGTLKVTKAMLGCLRRSKDLAKTIDTLGDKLRKQFEDGEIRPASLMIMTSGHIHIVKINRKFEVKWQKEHRSKKMAIGTGRTVALFLMEHVGHSAPDAVVAMELNHECCGGGATYTSRILTAQTKSILTMEHRDQRALSRHFLKNTIRSAKDKLAAMPSY